MDNGLLTLWLEFLSDAEPFIHLKYKRKPTLSEYKWTKSMVEELLITLGVFGIEFAFCHLTPGDDLNRKFVEAMGFRYLKSTTDGDIYFEEI